MENKIRECFSLLISFIRKNIKDINDYNINTMSAQDIKCEMDLLYMKYILSSSCLNSDKNTIGLGYKHLRNMIHEFELSNEVRTLQMENFLLKQELDSYKNMSKNILPVQNDNQEQSKGWFF